MKTQAKAPSVVVQAVPTSSASSSLSRTVTYPHARRGNLQTALAASRSPESGLDIAFLSKLVVLCRSTHLNLMAPTCLEGDVTNYIDYFWH